VQIYVYYMDLYATFSSVWLASTASVWLALTPLCLDHGLILSPLGSLWSTHLWQFWIKLRLHWQWSNIAFSNETLKLSSQHIKRLYEYAFAIKSMILKMLPCLADITLQCCNSSSTVQRCSQTQVQEFWHLRKGVRWVVKERNPLAGFYRSLMCGAGGGVFPILAPSPLGSSIPLRCKERKYLRSRMRKSAIKAAT
jgi:hypothetical protein